MEILHHVWALGEASVADVRERMLEYREVAYTTVMTIMKNLADKEFLKYRKEGLSYIYSAAINPDEVRGNLVHQIVDKVFKGSSKDLVQALVQNEGLSAEERREIKAMIDKLED